ncbi:hypothetical protein N9C66_05890 [Akkermansiaceae bacterium]|nr:hypothetical protein [Akkermansiaceae bacterium]
MFLLLLLSSPTVFAETNPLLERPIPIDGGPTIVECTLGILDIDGVSNVDQTFTVNVFTLFRWQDLRLRHDGPENARMKITEIWHPNLMFLNRQRIWASLDKIAEITPEGEVTLRQQFWGDFSQPMGLRDFPFDQQSFEIHIVSSDAGTTDKLKLVENVDIPSFLPRKYSVPDWEVVGFTTESKGLNVPNVGEISSFKMTFTADRISNHYLVKVMAPLLMIVLLAQVVFWLSPSEGGSQLGVAVTSFLTVIAYHVALNSKLPQISYLTKLDF